MDIGKEEFRKIGYHLIDQIAEFNAAIQNYPVTRGESSIELSKFIGNENLPENGVPLDGLVTRTMDLLTQHSLFNGHPKFMGFITSSPAPIGILADMVAATINPNVSAHILSPIATEIEKQTIHWLSEFIGLPHPYSGLLVSGGNMANFTAFLAARTAKGSPDLKSEGLATKGKSMISYCSLATHTWIEKASSLFGHGTKSIRWIPTDDSNQMDLTCLEETIQADLKAGLQPFLVVGTAGDVSTGVIDNLHGLSKVCKKYDLWFHVDGAYGAPAAVLPELSEMFHGLNEADSIALDPHKWLYIPLEAGCILVKEANHLTATFSSHPEYYNFGENQEGLAQNYYEYGLQNSRGFRALKVWMALQQVGKSGYQELISRDIELSRMLFQLSAAHVELEAMTQNLSICTFRYIPENFVGEAADYEPYLNTLNRLLLDSLQLGGDVFFSNAIVQHKYCLRACIVNFRTSKSDIHEILEIVVREGKKLDAGLQKNKDKWEHLSKN